MAKRFREAITKQRLLSAVVGLSLCLAWTATASAVLFDPTGGGVGIPITALDPQPGNAIAIGANAGSQVGDAFTLLYQANLGVVLNGSDIVFTQGGGGNFFTFVAGFGETVLSTTGGPNPFLQFDFDPANPTNFFFMYSQAATGNNLTGGGFVGVNPILSGHVVETDFTSSFNVAPVAPQNLDQSGANDWPGVTTVVGSGATSLIIVIDAFDAGYFPDLVAGTSLLLTNTSQVLPYAQIDPSAAFSTDGVTPLNQAGVPSVGAVNGQGDNTMFQADSNISILTPAVPEPASIALLGVGLVGLAGLSWLRRTTR